MPSASAIRPAVEPAMASTPAYDGTEPVRQIIKTVENKIRNLDKRKSKLESYQELRISGKNLTADQKVALTKYDEVVQWLLCANEFLKQIQGINVVYEKEQKNVQRKETAARVANEVFKVRETLILQDIIGHLRDPDVRHDFETGSNGAVQLEAEAWPLIDRLLAEGYVVMAESTSEDAYTTHAQRAADHWVSTVDGKPKQYSAGCTYEGLRKVVRAIQDSGYLQKKYYAPVPSSGPEEQEECLPTETAPEPVDEDQGQPLPDAADVPTTAAADDVPVEVCEGEAQSNHLPTINPPPVANSIVVPNEEAAPQATASSDQSIPVLENNAHATSTTTTGPVFVNAFAQAHLPPFMPPIMSAPQDPHALPEELQSGAFSFLQDSELDESIGHESRLSPNPVAAAAPTTNMPQPAQPANLMLINPLMAMGQSIPLEQLVVNGATNGTGGVTPPMFPYPFQAATATLTNGNGHPPGAPVPMSHPVAAAAPQPQEPTPAANFNQVPAAVVPTETMPTKHSGDNGLAKEPQETDVGTTDTMTISDWNPVAKGKPYHQNNDHQPREASTDSNGDRRRHNGRPPQENGGSGGYTNGSRRRYPGNDRGSNGTNGYNGSRAHQRGTDGESPLSSSNYRGGGERGNGTGNRPPHMNRGSNGGGLPQSNGGGGGGSGTFYRNNDPYYNGGGGSGGGAGMKGGRQNNNYGRRSSPPNGGVRN